MFLGTIAHCHCRGIFNEIVKDRPTHWHSLTNFKEKGKNYRRQGKVKRVLQTYQMAPTLVQRRSEMNERKRDEERKEVMCLCSRRDGSQWYDVWINILFFFFSSLILFFILFLSHQVLSISSFFLFCSFFWSNRREKENRKSKIFFCHRFSFVYNFRQIKNSSWNRNYSKFKHYQLFRFIRTSFVCLSRSHSRNFLRNVKSVYAPVLHCWMWK